MGMVRQWQELLHEKNYSESYTAALPDFVKLAESYGCIGIRAKSPDELDEKIAKLPNLLFLKTEEYELDFSDQQAKQLFISIQMEDSQSGKMTKRGGPVRLETDYYSVQMPQQVFLESDGFIRFPIEIDPPRKDDSEFDGLIQIRANMDDIGFDDVGEGMMVLRVVNGQRKRSLLIDPQSDLIEKR